MILTDWRLTLLGLDLTALDVALDTVTIYATMIAGQASCPRCGVASVRVHSRYVRTLAGSPWSADPSGFASPSAG